MSSVNTSTLQCERLFPRSNPIERAVPLSLLDATAANFAPTCAVWLCERPNRALDLSGLFRDSLEVTLNDYPQWTGQLKSISSLDSAKLSSEEITFAPHARRFGRLYAHFGTPQDPGVEFVTAKSTAALETLCPASRTTEHPLLDRQRFPLKGLVPTTHVVNPVQPAPPDQTSPLPALAIQLTELSCGGFSVAAKLAHPLGDIQSLVHFMRDWSNVMRWIMSTPNSVQPTLTPIFEPGQIDARAQGDINGENPDPSILEQIVKFPLQRYDWFADASQCPWTQEIPEPFRGQNLPPAGKTMPWSEWDTDAPVAHYLVHLSSKQVESIWSDAINNSTDDEKDNCISRHDAILAHVWSCIVRARNQHEDCRVVHCNLTIGTRPALHLSKAFIGSPTMMVNIERSGSEIAFRANAAHGVRTVARHIRKTISQMNNPTAIGAHLHTIAFEKTPQRIWQAFLGRRHLIVTSWARAGLYKVDFGFQDIPIVRYAEGIIPDLDGNVVIREAPPEYRVGGTEQGSWSDSGVDVSIQIRAEDMERLIGDPGLFRGVTTSY